MKHTYTLERHLHRLAEESEETKELESVYTLQKKKMNRYLSSVSTTFPTYSSHDTEHSRSIIASIEMILGKKYIKKLSGTDTFLLLTCAYMHDVGMLYSDEEVRKLWTGSEFQSFLDDCLKRDGEVKKAACLVRKGISDTDSDTDPLWPLELRSSITILLMEYYRPLHGVRVEKNTDSFLQGISELLCLDETFIPRRLNEAVKCISTAHTGDFDAILSGLQREDSYGRDYFHPRMVAFLLRMGDLCDLDNNRFNKVSIATFGTMGDENLAHYFKHTSVNTLYLSHERITIVADVRKKSISDECERTWLKDEENDDNLKRREELIFQNTVREHLKWRSMLEQELRNVKLYGKEIFPSDWKFMAPELEYEIRINGEKVVAEDANLRFLFPQERAFQLIESISIYGEEKFIFVRELLQNAIDASKIQLWRDICGDYDEEVLSPFKMRRNDIGLFDRYRIDIQVEVNEDSNLAHISIADHGIGISRRELKENILTTGKSWSKREGYKEELESMPKWLKPTGSFGIGLHTVFYVTDRILILTKSDTEQFVNRITLDSGKNDGYAFCEKSETPRTRGATFELDMDLSGEEIRGKLGYGTRDSFLKVAESDVESKLISMLEEHCSQSLFPVYVNGSCILRGLTEADEFARLGEGGSDGVLPDVGETERFQWAFEPAYEILELWDQDHNLAVRFSLEKDNMSCLYPEYNFQTFFRGMHVAESMEFSKKVTCLHIECLDIEEGESSEVMDAGRSRINRGVQENIFSSLEECIEFAEQRYFDLMEAVENSEDVKSLETEADDVAENYICGEMDAAEAWKAACRIRGKLLPLEPELDPEVRKDLGFETRIATHMVHCTILDRIFYHYACYVIKMDFSSVEDWLAKIPIYPFAVLDDLIRRWKCDWKMEATYFKRHYFNCQLLEIIRHYMVVFGMVAVESLCRKNIYLNKQESLHFEVKTEKFLREQMPMVSKWRKGAEQFRIFHQIIKSYCGDWKYDVEYTENDICGHLLKPVSACIFDEWKYKGTYAGKDDLSLKFAVPYMHMLFLCMTGKEAWNRQKRGLWKNIMEQSIYSQFSYGAENLLAVTNLPETEKFTVLCEGQKNRDDLLPFLPAMDIVTVELRPGKRKICYAKTSSHPGAEADEESIRFAFSKCLNHMEETARRGAKTLESMYGFSKYENLVIRSKEYSNDLYTGVSSEHWEIPLWNYSMEIIDLLDRFSDRNEPDNFWRCLDEIVTSESVNRVVEYIFQVRKRQNHFVEKEKIRQQYEAFIDDFLHVWWGNHPIACG